MPFFAPRSHRHPARAHTHTHTHAFRPSALQISPTTPSGNFEILVANTVQLLVCIIASSVDFQMRCIDGFVCMLSYIGASEATLETVRVVRVSWTVAIEATDAQPACEEQAAVFEFRNLTFSPHHCSSGSSRGATRECFQGGSANCPCSE